MNDSLPTSSGPAPSGVSRRTVVKGAAWAVPVIAVAGAVPAMAASGRFDIRILAACKSPGKSCKPFDFGYVFTTEVSVNETGLGGYITMDTVSITNPGVTLTNPSDHFPFTAGTGSILYLYVIGTNSANLGNAGDTITVTWTAHFTDGDTITDSFVYTIPATPPDCVNLPCKT